MQLPLSASVVDHLEILDACGSTNTELVARAADPALPDFSVLVTGDQTAGRGRLGRVWVAPPGKTLAISVLLRPRLPAGEPLGVEHFGWLPLIAGLAMTWAINALAEEHLVRLKWPNDVQIDGKKVSGLLAELLPGGDAVVMGAGVNLTIESADLPTPTSTSLLLEGATLSGDELADVVLSRYLTELRSLVSEFLRFGGDPVASGITDLVDELCSTIGQEVRVELPGGDDLHGTAIGIDGTGRLQVKSSADGGITAVAAGDVTHLRYE
ncbi:biotin--[acetyl-CoA-carboxylase] ligase [Lacisediminihabitans changchengi]|uniref:biotin--[biotin carboxyl-carrier protein] ligase n=1 Tax=Lacisediminihabitans changchengi TaxID=2787634 RepID=A0A934W5T6_9MICO|nr:biotin--[acetyl-CoA-carboxylase] ligase [Lacisediminihabitans changchengi]MBK4348885.1 biotin--[acetyl-CoA-carboxylase] ligase [Lacisediminihabitans changchengi]